MGYIELDFIQFLCLSNEVINFVNNIYVSSDMIPEDDYSKIKFRLHSSTYNGAFKVDCIKLK